MEDKLYTSLIEIIQHPEKKQRLMDLLTQKISEEMKKFLETLFLIERELFCTERNDVGNGYYERSLKMPS